MGNTVFGSLVIGANVLFKTLVAKFEKTEYKIVTTIVKANKNKNDTNAPIAGPIKTGNNGIVKKNGKKRIILDITYNTIDNISVIIVAIIAGIITPIRIAIANIGNINFIESTIIVTL